MKSFAPKPWVVPQPVLIIGTYNKEGVANAMNAAWAGQWDMKEIIISMGNHVTTDNLKLGGEFTVAFATKKTMVASDFVGIVSAKNDPKKMEKTGWNIKKANMVNAPVFTDFPMTLECRIKEKYDESETGYYLVAEIVNILVDEKYLAEDGNPDMEKMELIVQKAVELGAARVVPVAMKRCVVQLSAKDGAKKQERWQKIAREACKQSGRCQMMAVDSPIAFPALLAALKTHEAAIVPWEDARGYSLTAFHREHPDIRDLAIVIGTEGGMSADEIARMKGCGCQSVTLGPRILRTETAGLCALSALFCLYGELE